MAKTKRDAASSTTPDHDSSSSSFPSDYEVFLSFRGPDTRKTFTDHLYHALVNHGIRTFRDDEELPIGEEIDPLLRSAIHESKIAIPIFSKGYASSKWCLRELAEIVECMKQEEEGQRQITVMPVFYHVNPSDVRHQTGCYEEAFRNHEKRYSQETEGWKKALKEIADLKGWDVEKIADGHEGKLIQLIAKEVWSELRKKSTLIVSDNLVGIHSHVEEMIKFLSIGCKDIQIVGILGLGGIGKTTIARCVYNTIYHYFEGSSFLADVRETFQSFQTKGLVHLQCQLVSNILNIESPNITSVDQGIGMIKRRLSNKNVLIVVDDADQNTDLSGIIGKRDWYGIGSRIIITTRDRSILDFHEADNTYEPNEMDSDDSLLLFSKHAFRKDQPPEQYLDLSKEVIKIAGGLPLALEVLGSSLYRKSDSAWKGTVKKLKKVPNQKVLGVLRISYDGLDRVEKEMFLDIACFFIGMKKDIACYICDGCGFYAEAGIDILRKKSLVKIDENDELRMHDQLRVLGREIVREENPMNPGEHSRLWLQSEVLDVLNTQKGTGKVEGLCIDFKFRSQGKCLMSEGFASMTKLRLLQLDYARVAGNLVHSFSELRWLSWKGCPIQFTPTNVRKLVVLDLSNSDITENWMGWNYIKEAETLKVLNLSGCEKLSHSPNFSANLNLEILIFKECRNLVTIDESIGHLKRLVSLNMNMCLSLRCLPTSICELSSLKTLNIEHTKIGQLPENFGCLEALREFKVCFVKLRLPNSIGNLRNLKTLSAEYCKIRQGEILDTIGTLSSLEFLSLARNPLCSLPATVSALSLLQTLSLEGCCNLHSLPELPSSLKSLNASNSKLKSLPKLSHLTNLEELNLHNCRKLAEIPITIDALTRLKSLRLRGCVALKYIPVLPSGLTNLDADECKNLIGISGLLNMKNLVELGINKCGSLRKFPKLLGLKKLTHLKLTEIGISEIEGLEGLYSLEKLIMEKCFLLRKIPNFSDSKNLELIDIRFCEELSEIESLEGLDSLEQLTIEGCHSLTAIPKLSCSKNLVCEEIRNRTELSEIEGLEEGLDSLKRFIIMGCGSLRKIPNLSYSRNLVRIEIRGCHKLSEIEGLKGLYSLKILIIEYCPSLRKIPNLSDSKNLVRIDISSCNELSEVEGLEGLDSPEELQLHICGCHSLTKIHLPRKLSNLAMSKCKKFSEIEGLEDSEALREFSLLHFKSIVRLPNLSKLKNLKCLNIQGLKMLPEIGSLEGLESLEELMIRDAPSLKVLPDVSTLKNLKHLELSGCDCVERLLDLSNLKKLKKLEVGYLKKLTEIPSVDKLESLEVLEIEWCKSMERLPDLSNLTKLRELCIRYCDKLSDIKGVDRLEILEVLCIDGCISIETLPCLSNLKKLRNLSAVNCKKLTEIQGVDNLESLEKLDVRGCISIKLQACGDLNSNESSSSRIGYGELDIWYGDSSWASDLRFESSDDDSPRAIHPRSVERSSFNQLN